MNAKSIDGVAPSNLAPYANVRHAPPYLEVEENGRPKRQIWDGVGVIALNQDPALIKSAYFGIERLEEPFVIVPPVVIYEAKANNIGIRRAHIFLLHNSAVVVSRYDIKTATGASYRKPTAEEIDRALHYLQLIRRLEGTSGNLSYYPVCMDYAEVAFGRTTMMMPVKTKKEVYVPQKLEERLMQYSK